MKVDYSLLSCLLSSSLLPEVNMSYFTPEAIFFSPNSSYVSNNGFILLTLQQPPNHGFEFLSKRTLPKAMCHAITSITTYMGEGSTCCRSHSFVLNKILSGLLGLKDVQQKKPTADNIKKKKKSISERRQKIHVRKRRLEKYITISSYPVTGFHSYKIQPPKNLCDGAMKAQHSDLESLSTGCTFPTSPSD